jgi:translation elongation factor aEF-1 beta
MAKVYITFKIMPESTETDLDQLEGILKSKTEEMGAVFGKVEKEPIGFGLCALNLFITMEEASAETDKLEEGFRSVEGVMSAESVDIRKALG